MPPPPSVSRFNCCPVAICNSYTVSDAVENLNMFYLGRFACGLGQRVIMAGKEPVPSLRRGVNQLIILDQISIKHDRILPAYAQ
jgi:hypothetical protein